MLNNSLTDKFAKAKKFTLLALSSLLLLLIYAALGVTSFHLGSQPNKTSSANNQQKVLGAQTPQIYLSAPGQGYSSGGLIALASTDEPSVVLNSYNISGIVQASLYKANQGVMLDYLTHDKNGKQTITNPDISKFTFINNFSQQINSQSQEGTRLLLPLDDSGIWFLRIKYGTTQVDSFILRSNTGVLVKEGDNQFIFWGQNFKTRRSIQNGSLTLYNLQDSAKQIGSSSFDSNGIATAQITKDADIALVQQGNDLSLVPINLHYLNTGYRYNIFQPKTRQTKYFIFTDRPIYKPGDKVYFKTVLRDDDDARYSIPSGNATIKIYNGYGDQENVLFQNNYSISPDGTISGSYDLSPDLKTGYYSLEISINGSTTGYSNFDVEFYRKPEYFIDVTTPQTEYISGDKSQFTITGSYFSGQPMINQKVKYTIYSGDFYEYEYLTQYQISLSNDYRYGYWNGKIISQGTATLNQKGVAQIDLNTQLPAGVGKSQVFSIEADYDNGSGNPTFSRKNVLVYSGEYGIYRKDQSFYSSQVGTTLSLPIILSPIRNASVANISLTANLHRENWIPYQDPNFKYPRYRKEEEDLPSLQTKSDSQGNAIFSFTPTKIGSYTFTVTGRDARGNTILKVFYSYVSSQTQTYYTQGQANDLSIHTDKEQYLPSDSVSFTINSTTADRDIFLSLERGRVNRYQIVHLFGSSTVVNVPLVTTDIPNIYASVSSFSSSSLDRANQDVIVSTDSKELKVNITPNAKTFGPGDNVTVNVQTTDIGGNPLSADVALWSVDKALYQLTDERPDKIFDTFWSHRYNSTQSSHSLEGIPVLNAEMGGGCFATGTQVLMADRKTKNIENIKSGDEILTRKNESDQALTKAKVTSLEKATDSGYFIINGYLKITENHRLWVNNSWEEANLIKVGDSLTNDQGKNVKVASVEWITGKFTVYNLEIEKYHTYFAGGVWVHNQKGGVRSIFKDTAYWNPSIHTDISGHAQVTFKLPDNLTTWVVSAIGSTQNTQVGQTTTEIVVTKDVIVRPILPNIFRTGDNAVVSAIVQNFTASDHTFDTSLRFDSGDVREATQTAITIKSNDSQQVYWPITPTKENASAKLTFSAQAQDDKKVSDIIVEQIPVRPFGYAVHRAETGIGPKDYTPNLSVDDDLAKTKVSLSLSPTIIGSLPTAMKYLIYYPYGCVEQTTSSFVPAVIAKTNPNLFSDSLTGTNIDDIVQKGANRLASMQRSDGGWTWWFTGTSDPFVTSYVVEYLVMAKQAGYKIDDSVISNANRFLAPQESPTSQADVIAMDYALAFQGIKNGQSKIKFNFPESSYYLGLAVMANYLNGDKNPDTNGLNLLISKAKPEGDALFWEAGTKLHFGSVDASTALAIRAILLAGGDRNIAAKGVTYLMRHRRYDYWSNTYATAQVIRALVDFSKTGSETNPNYNYSVLLDGNAISQGSVSSQTQTIKDITIPTNSIKPTSKISIVKSGDGQLYSTLVIDEFHTDRNANALSHGIKITRAYQSEKGANYSLAVGDTVTVSLTVSGLTANDNYGVIKDELPAGLIPINESFKNEQYGQNYASNYYWTDEEITENGAILSLYQVGTISHTYTYKARVVSEGTFTVPPATASLMYAPEIYGQSATQQVITTKESQITLSNLIQQKVRNLLSKNPTKLLPYGIITVLLGLLVIEILVLAGIIKKESLKQISQKVKNLLKRNNIQPPQTPPAAPSPQKPTPPPANTANPQT